MSKECFCAHGASWPLASAELALAGYILLSQLIFVHFALTVRRFWGVYAWGILKGNENQTLSCPVLMAVGCGHWNQMTPCPMPMAMGSGHLSPLEPQPGQSRASLGVTCWIRYYSWPQEKGENPECWVERGSPGHFILPEFPSDGRRAVWGPQNLPCKGRNGDWLKHFFLKGSRTSCYRTGSEFSPLGRSAASWRTPDPVENLMSYKKLESSGKILRKRRSHGLSQGRPTLLSSLPQEALPQFPSLKGYRWHHLGGPLT